MGFASHALVPLLAIAAIAPLPLFGQTGELSAGRSPAPACAAREAPDARPFDKTRPEVLVGRYELTVVSQWHDEKGRTSTGLLELLPTDSLRCCFFPTDRTDHGDLTGWKPLNPRFHRSLYGWSDIDLEDMTVPTAESPERLHSRDPDAPGLIWEFGRLELAPVRLYSMMVDGKSAWLDPDSLSNGGFWGRWDSGFGLYRLVDDAGRILPNPHGTFCARRLTYESDAGRGVARIRHDGREGRPGQESSRTNQPNAEGVEQLRLAPVQPLSLAEDRSWAKRSEVGKCDPIWDGALFGVLPGIALGGMFGIAGICGEHDSCAPYMVIGAVAGAGVGLLMDEVSCDQKNGGIAGALYWPPASDAARTASRVSINVPVVSSLIQPYKLRNTRLIEENSTLHR